MTSVFHDSSLLADALQKVCNSPALSSPLSAPLSPLDLAPLPLPDSLLDQPPSPVSTGASALLVDPFILTDRVSDQLKQPEPPPLPPPRSPKAHLVPTLIQVPRRSLDGLSAEQRVARRRTNNKVYAKQSRERRKCLMSHLMKERAELESDIAALRARRQYELDVQQKLQVQRDALLAHVAAIEATVPVALAHSGEPAHVPQ